MRITNTLSSYWPIGLSVACLLMALALSGCGQQDLCADTDCSFGSCNSETGECENPSECHSTEDCIPGYECDDYQCEALTECSEDDDCEAGVCDEGVCVNPTSCEENDDCLERTFCGPDGECEPDPCRNKSCQRGVCQRGTDQCVSADSCTRETQLRDCVAGERCANGSCESADDFCEELDCDRGECSFEQGECTNAGDCEGDDENCLEGYFCNDQDICQVDACIENDVDCGDDGVCEPKSGVCVNADECEDDSQCRPDHHCIDGTCAHEDTACGDAEGDGGCPGNQICDIGEDEATCEEPEECETSFDCREERQCGGKTCLDPVSCEEDTFEPNDEDDEAVEFLEAAEDNTLGATMCQEDVDMYTFDSAELLDEDASGTIFIELDVRERNRGLGQVHLEVTDPEGETRTTSTGSQGDDGSIAIEEVVGKDTHGDYTVEVAADDDMTEAGVAYDLSVNLVPHETKTACEEAQVVQPNQRIEGHTDESKSNAVNPGCLDSASGSTEEIYELELDAPQEVTFDLKPQDSETDLTLALQSRCTQPATELECVNETGGGEDETLTTLLDEGSHYIVVQGADGSSGGPFELEIDSIFTSCSDRQDYCTEDGTAQVCDSDGGQFDEIDCYRQCDASRGRCLPPEGNTCGDAPVIDPDSFANSDSDSNDDSEGISAEYDTEFDLRQVTNEYELGEDGEECFEEGEPRTDGPDQTYQVELPAETGVVVTTSFSDEVEGSLYLVEDCDDLEGTCQTGVSGSTDLDYNEELIHTNLSDEDKTYYLVIDVDDDQSVSTGHVDFDFEPVVCEPESRWCNDGGDVEQCNELGTEFEVEDECADGVECLTGYCRTGETCQQAMPMEDGDTHSNDYSGTNDVDPADGDAGECSFSQSYYTEGRETVYEVELEKDELLHASYSDGSISTVMYIMEDCDDNSSCVKNTASSASSGDLYYVAEEDETVFVVVDRTSDFSSSITFDFEVNIQDIECDPDTDGVECKDSDTAQSCVEPGLWEEYTCSGSCSNGACDDEGAESCFNPKQMDDGDTDQQYYDGGNNVDPVAEGGIGNCSMSSTSGPDYVYAVDLESGETLDASYDDGNLCGNGTSVSTQMYMLTDCFDGSTCEENTSTGYTGSINYTANSDETVYVVVERDSSPTTTFCYRLTVNIN